MSVVLSWVLLSTQLKPKEKEKLAAEIEYAAARLGRYTQPIAYMITYAKKRIHLKRKKKKNLSFEQVCVR